MKLAGTHLADYVTSVVSAGRVPGLSVALLRNNEITLAAAGRESVETGAPVGVDTLFQIGSISKVFTATLIMLLADKGRLDIDAPVKTYLGDFNVGDKRATASVTVRQLLSHTSGLETDIYTDDQWESGNPIARYVDRCHLLPQVHEDFGQRFSYSNAAYVVAGRVAEVVSEMSYGEAIERLIYRPLGMRNALSAPAQVVQHKFAIGHMYAHDSETPWTRAPHAFVPRGMAPAGSCLAMTAGDLLKFGKAHLDRGRNDEGQAWLSSRGIDDMQQTQVTLPLRSSLFEDGWGLGWSLSDIMGVKSVGHGGGRIGYQAWLQFLPEHDAVLAVTGNGMTLGGGPIIREIISDFVFEIAGVRPAPPALDLQPRPLERYCGSYGASGFRFDIVNGGEYLDVDFHVEGASTGTVRLRLQPTKDETFAVYSQSGELWDQVRFLDFDEGGRPRFFFFAHRLNARRQIAS